MARKEVKLKRLKRSNNGTRRDTFSGGAYKYQKKGLIKQAHQNGMTVSYYLNYLLWKDSL